MAQKESVDGRMKNRRNKPRPVIKEVTILPELTVAPTPVQVVSVRPIIKKTANLPGERRKTVLSEKGFGRDRKKNRLGKQNNRKELNRLLTAYTKATEDINKKRAEKLSARVPVTFQPAHRQEELKRLEIDRKVEIRKLQAERGRVIANLRLMGNQKQVAKWIKSTYITKKS
jgi:hypothetical protein